MLEAWQNFAILVAVQFLLFITHAYYAKKLSDVPRILALSAPIGLAMGLSYDLALGKFLDLSSYALGFGAFFLTLNAILSYGLFVANTLLLQKARLLYFYIWTVFVMAVYEITSHFFRVWTWEFGTEFALPPTLFVAVLSLGYFSGALLVAIIAHFFGYRFFFLERLFKK